MKRAVVISVLACALAWAGVESQIEGSVWSSDGSPMRGAVIHFIRIDKKQREFTVKTNKAGHYGYFGLPGGQYDIKAFSFGGKMIDVREGVNITGVPVQFDFKSK